MSKQLFPLSSLFPISFLFLLWTAIWKARKIFAFLGFDFSFLFLNGLSYQKERKK